MLTEPTPVVVIPPASLSVRDAVGLPTAALSPSAVNLALRPNPSVLVYSVSPLSNLCLSSQGIFFS